MPNFSKNAVRAKATAGLECSLNLLFSDGSQKIKNICEGDLVKDLTYKDDSDNLQTIDGIVKVINFSSGLSESAGIDEKNLVNSKSVFSTVVRPISLVVDTSEVYKSDVVNVPISDIVNIKADSIINEKYQGTVHTVDSETTFASAIADAVDGDTILVTGGTYDEILDVSKAVRITAKKDENNEYEPVVFSNLVTISAAEGTVEIDHVTFKDITSAEGTGPNKSTAKGNGIDVTGNADINFHDNYFENFNNFYNMISVKGTGKVVIEDNEFKNGKNYHVVEFAVSEIPVSEAVIRNNYFGDICTHNVISFYNFTDDSKIVIADNTFEYSGNALRISNTNNGTASFEISGNVFFATDHTDSSADENCSSDTYGGFSILQDYTGNQDFNKINMIFSQNYYKPVDGIPVLVSDKTANTEAQAYYVYKDKAEFKFTYPVVEFMN